MHSVSSTQLAKRSIALVGFRTTGKSHVGKLLAQSLHWPFLDMDIELVRIRGEDITRWVDREGWASFRTAESQLLRELAAKSEMVVATGGGIVLAPSNRAVLRQFFHVIWLQASPETIGRRLSADAETTSSLRPALTALPPDEEVRQLLRERDPLYGEVANCVVATDRLSPDDVAARLLSIFSGTDNVLGQP